MTDVSWTIGTNDDGDLTADRLEADSPPPVVKGKTVELRFGFETKSTYETLRDYLDYTGAVVVKNDRLDGEPYYRINHRQTKTQLLSFDPDGTDMPSSVEGFWGVLVDGSDASNSTVSDWVLSLRVFMLAELSEHADRSAAKTAHEV